jgi:hypothetical protein
MMIGAILRNSFMYTDVLALRLLRHYYPTALINNLIQLATFYNLK